MEHIVIIGNGISGITAARYIRKLSKHKITVISAETDYFFSRTALMYVYMGHMRWRDIEPYENWFWKKNRIDLKKGFVNKVDTDKKTLHFDSDEKIKYDKLILATGARTNYFDWKGQDLKGVQGLVSKQDLELLEENTRNHPVRKAVIVGGGLIGVELAEMLRTRNIEVTMLVREFAFWGNVLPKQEADMLARHIRSHGVEILLETELEEILGGKNGRAKVVKTKAGKEIECQLVGISTGVNPNIAFLKNSKIETDKGVLVNRKLETNIPCVFAIGDCAQQRTPIENRNAVESVWYTGRTMGETLAQTICGNPTEYKPGNWFNSAKFFDIEYQTYGHVWSEAKTGEDNFYWEPACRQGRAEDQKKAVHLNFETETRKFLGINTFGIRMRHEVLDRWLTEGKTVDFVVENLAEANFDPEFYRRFEKEIKNSFKLEPNLTGFGNP
ncbi:MAG TPA: FAD-dependent oxidoreductase [Flavobacteriaceae bacterium]|nr:FAD-dependent oxidoreductase [Flavobacteriaceae bacterium]